VHDLYVLYFSGVARDSQWMCVCACVCVWGGGGGGGGGGQSIENIRGLRAPLPAAGNWGSRGKASSRRRQEDLGEKPSTLGDFCNFSIKITQFYAYFDQIRYFKAITYQLKAFEKQSKRTK